MKNLKKKKQIIHNYLLSQCVPQECRGFFYLHLLLTNNIEKSNVIRLTINEMVQSLGTELNISEATLLYHLKVVMRKTNQKRKENSLPEYTLRRFVAKTFIDIQNGVWGE